MSSKRGQKASALERWAELVDEDELVAVDSDELKAIAQYAARRDRAESALIEAVQAAQRKYAKLAS